MKRDSLSLVSCTYSYTHIRLRSILRYFVSSGSLKDPVTRVEWGEEDLKRLQVAVTEKEMGVADDEERKEAEREVTVGQALIDVIKVRAIEKKGEQLVVDTVLSLERALGGLVGEILKVLCEQSHL